MNNFSNIQDWVDGFSGLNNYSRVSIDTWYKMRPKLKSYPETFSAITPGFGDSIIDNSIITLATTDDAKKVNYAKNRLVDRMREYFSVSDMKVVDMNSALDQSREQSTYAAPTAPGNSLKNQSGTSGTLPVGGTYSYDQSDLVSYIANKCNLGAENIAAALQEFGSQPYPMSRVVINNILCNRYNFPINNDGEVVSRISKYLTKHIDIRDEKLDRLTLAKEVINKYLPADNFLVMDILNVYMDPNLSATDVPHIISDLFKANGSFAPDHVINQIILSLSDTFKRYDMEKQDPSPSVPEDFARKEAISLLNQVFKDHRLKLAANEVKWVYDAYVQNGMDAEKTAPIITNLETESGRVLYEDTAKEVLEDFRNRARDMRVTDGQRTFSNKNFANITDSVAELSDLAASAGVDDRFVIDNFDELTDILTKASSTSTLLSSLASYFLMKGYAQTPEEADLISQDLFAVVRESDWARKHMKNLRNFSRNNLIERMFSLGYSDRDIAIKLHQPLAEVRNFAFKRLGTSESWVNKGIDYLQNSPMFNWMTPSKPVQLPGFMGSKIDAPDRWTFMTRLAALGGGLYAAGAVMRPYLKTAWRKMTGNPITPEEMYSDIKALAEQDRIYRSNQGRMAQAIGNMAEMMVGAGPYGNPYAMQQPMPVPMPPQAPVAAPSPSGLNRPQ